VVKELCKAASTTTLAPCFIHTGEMAFDGIQRGNANRLTVAYGRLPINLRHDREVDVVLLGENRAMYLDIAGD
jgi:hypothetical protein